MRMLKKLLLAGAFIGVLGSFGFAQEAKADINFDGSTDDILKVGPTTSGNKIVIKAGSVELVNETLTTLSSNGFSIDSIKGKVNDAAEGSDIVTGLDVAVTDTNNTSWAGWTKSYVLPKNLFKVKVRTATGGSSVVTSNKDKSYQYGYDGDTASLKATASEGYDFSHWTKGSTKESESSSCTVTIVAAAEYTPVFDQFAPDEITLRATYNGTPHYDDFTMSKDKTVTFGLIPDESYDETKCKVSNILYTPDETGYFSGTGATRTAVAVTPTDYGVEWYGSCRFTSKKNPTNYVDIVTVNSITIKVTDGGSTSGVRINLSEFKDYITEGYTLEFIASAKDSAGDVTISNMKWSISSGDKYVDGDIKVEDVSDKKYQKKIKIKFKDEQLEKGTNSADVKIQCKVNYSNYDTASYSPIDSDTDKEKKITVYSNPTSSYNNSERTMSYKVPAKVNTGTESGKDSNNSDTQDALSDVKGIRLNILLGDNVIGYTNQSKSTSATLDANTMETMVTNLANKGSFTGDCTITLRAYPTDGSNKYNKRVYHDTYAKVYKVVLKPGQSATAGAKTASAYALPIAMIAQRNTGATTTTATTTAAGKEYVLYGLEGQTLTAPAGVTDIVDSNGNAVTKIVVSADANKNVYTYAATASATKEGLDKVPKTGQNNVFVYVMAVVVCGAVGYGLYVYNKKSMKSI